MIYSRTQFRTMAVPPRMGCSRTVESQYPRSCRLFSRKDGRYFAANAVEACESLCLPCRPRFTEIRPTQGGFGWKAGHEAAKLGMRRQQVVPQLHKCRIPFMDLHHCALWASSIGSTISGPTVSLGRARDFMSGERTCDCAVGSVCSSISKTTKPLLSDPTV